jgi:hypothetical protein
MAQLQPSVSVQAEASTNTALTTINLLQPTGFKLTIDRRHYANLEFFAQSILHPSMEMNAAEQPYQRVGAIPFAGDKLTFTELTCIIIVDEEMNAYTEMYNWMHRLVETNEIGPDKAIRENVPTTYSDMTLSILSSHNNLIRSIKYKDCIPIALGDMVLEATAGDTQYITFPATFRFSHFELT